MKRFILLLFVCTLLISGCGTVRYEKRYQANLIQYSKLIKPVRNPKIMGDSIRTVLLQNIEANEDLVSSSKHKYNTWIALGAAGTAIGTIFNIGKQNKLLLVGISGTAVILGVLDLFLTIPEPLACDKKARILIANWNNSTQDNNALNSLRAGLYSIQETWPHAAP